MLKDSKGLRETKRVKERGEEDENVARERENVIGETEVRSVREQKSKDREISQAMKYCKEIYTYIGLIDR